MKTQTKQIIYVSILLMGISFLQVSAAELLWLGGSGSWNDPARWIKTSFPIGNCNCVPTSNDNVTIRSGIVTIPEGPFPGTTYHARSIKIETNAELRVGGTFPFHVATLSIGPGDLSGIDIDSGGKLFVFAKDKIVIDGIHNTSANRYAINNRSVIDVGINASITITNSDGGIYSDTRINNNGNINISDINFKRGLHVIGVFDIGATGTLNINDITHGVNVGQGIFLSADLSSFNNLGTLSIANVDDNAVHMIDNSTFNNAGVINIDDYREAGIRVEFGGAFFNSNTLTISNATTTGSFGIRTDPGGEFTNTNKINISNINSQSSGIWNRGRLFNRESSIITVNNFLNDGIINHSTGRLENEGEIIVSENQGSVSSIGFLNFGDLSNKDEGEISIFNIDGINSHGFYNDENAVFKTGGRIAVSGVPKGYGLIFINGEFIVTRNATVVTSDIGLEPLDIRRGVEFETEVGALFDLNN